MVRKRATSAQERIGQEGEGEKQAHTARDTAETERRRGGRGRKADGEQDARERENRRTAGKDGR